MIRLAAAALLLASSSAPAQRGYAAHYQKGVMESVSKRRGLPLVECMIAADAPIGRWYTVVSLVNDRERRCRVTDVCHPRDCPRLARRGIILEFDFRSGMAMCDLQYYGQEPPSKCPVMMWP